MARVGSIGSGSRNSGSISGGSLRTEQMNDDYWYNLFYGTPYFDLYQSIMTQYSGEVPDTLWGYVTGSNAMNEYDRMQARNQALTDLAAKMQTDQYNSPSNQVALDKQAGLNPDLLGVSGIGKSEAPNFTPQNPVAPNASAEAQSAMGIFTSVLSSALGMYQQMKQIQNLSLQNTGLQLSNASQQVSIGDQITPMIKNWLTNEMAKGFSGKHKMSFEELKEMFAEEFKGNPTLSRIARRRFDSVARSSDFESSRAAYEKVMADQKAMLDFENGMVEYQVLANKHALKAQKAKSKYETEFYTSLDGVTEAQARNRENMNKGWLDKWRNDFYEKLYEDFKYRGSDLAGLLLISAGQVSTASVASTFLNWSGTTVSDGIDKLLNYFK